jgi:hypothetical protein
MEALLHMIDTEDDLWRMIALCSAKEMTIVHRRCHQELNEDTIKRGWFLSSGLWILGLGPTFGDHWRLDGKPDPQGKPFTGLRVQFVGVPSEVHKVRVGQAGGQVVDKQEQANVIVVPNRQPANLGAHAAVMIVTEEVFRRALPGARRQRSLVWTELWKLLSSRDLRSIRQGIDLAATLSREIDDLLQCVEVNEEGEIVRGPHFSMAARAQPLLDVTLLSLLSGAPSRTRAAALRAKVRKIVTIVNKIPTLRGFETLETLRLTLTPGTSATDLRAFGPLLALRVLFITCQKSDHRGTEPVDATLRSLFGLQAPALEQLSINGADLRNVDALGGSPRLKTVDLGSNTNLDRIDGLGPASASLRALDLGWCKTLTSIAPLEGATQLRRVDLSHCRSLVSVKPLSACEGFDELDLAFCSGLTSIESLAGKPVGNYEFALCFTSLTSFIGLPTNVSNLFASDTPVNDLTPLCALEHLKQVALSNSPKLIDAGPLGALCHLRRVDLDRCRKLEWLPARWSAPLDSLDLRGCERLRSLDGLPASLTSLGYKYGESITTTIDLSGCSKIDSLKPIAGTGLATTTTRIELDGCVGLRTLAGLEALQALKAAWLPTTITDASALAQHARLMIEVSLAGLVTFPAGLGKALSVLPRVKLAIRCGYCLEDGSGLPAITSLVYLDLRDCHNLKDISWVVGFPSLKRLYLAEGSPATKQAKARHFDTRTKVRELQLAICANRKSPLPPHLDTASRGD